MTKPEPVIPVTPNQRATLAAAAADSPPPEPPAPNAAPEEAAAGAARADSAGPATPAPSPPSHPHPIRRPVAKKPRHGIKLQRRDGAVVHGRISGPWLEVVESRVPGEHLESGLEFARIGQTRQLEMAEGLVTARVQDIEPRAYECRVEFAPIETAQWESIIEAMAKEAVYLVKMLAGELPSSFETLLESFGVRAVDPAAITMTCTCPRGGNCRHVATVAYLLAERLDADARLILTLRGMATERVLERLRQARVMNTRGVSAAHVDPLIPASQEDPPPLAAVLETYWRSPSRPDETSEMPPPHHVPHALLRRLGPSPLQARFPLAGLLASIYDVVAEDVLALRDRAERLEDD